MQIFFLQLRSEPFNFFQEILFYQEDKTKTVLSTGMTFAECKLDLPNASSYYICC